MSNDYFAERKAERKPVHIEAVYILNGIQASCEILDLSSSGLRMRVRGLLYKDDQVNIQLDKQLFRSVVMNAEGNIVGVKFDNLSDIQLNYLLNLKNI